MSSTYSHLIYSLALATLLIAIPFSFADNPGQNPKIVPPGAGGSGPQPIPKSVPVNNPLIIDTCKKVAASPGGNYEVCLNLFQSDPRSGTATLEGLALISCDVTRLKTAALESHIKTLIGFPHQIGKAFEDCTNKYSEAENLLFQASQKLQAKDYSSASTFITNIRSVPQRCNLKFKGGENPLLKENNEILSLYGVPIVVTSLLVGPPH